MKSVKLLIPYAKVERFNTNSKLFIIEGVSNSTTEQIMF